MMLFVLEEKKVKRRVVKETGAGPVEGPHFQVNNAVSFVNI
jgi:hypothetical protein